MRALWNLVSIIAVVNLAAILGAVGWLSATKRIDSPRARQVREMFTKTIDQQKAEEDEAARKVEEERKAAEAAAKAARAPLTASEQLTARIEASELDRQRVASLKNQIESLQRALTDSQNALAIQRKEVDLQRQELARAKAEAAANVGEEQFQKTLNILTALKPSEARSMLSEILYGVAPAASPKFREAGGTPPANADPNQTTPAPISIDDAPAATDERPKPGKVQVLAYLDAMEEKPRIKILSEFMKTSPKLAAELLESLRARGQVAAVPGNSPP